MSTCSKSRLPIDVVPNTDPPRFKWQQTVTTINGSHTVDLDGRLPPSVEKAVVDLIKIARAQEQEIIGLRRMYEQASSRVAEQSDSPSSLSKKRDKK